MKHVMVNYRVRKEKLGEVLQAISEFVDAVKNNEPRTLIYEVFQEEDSVSFVHFISFEDEKAEEIHRNTSHVSKFVDSLYANCETQPVFTELTLLRSTRRP